MSNQILLSRFADFLQLFFAFRSSGFWCANISTLLGSAIPGHGSGNRLVLGVDDVLALPLDGRAALRLLRRPRDLLVDEFANFFRFVETSFHLDVIAFFNIHILAFRNVGQFLGLTIIFTILIGDVLTSISRLFSTFSARHDSIDANVFADDTFPGTLFLL